MNHECNYEQKISAMENKVTSMEAQTKLIPEIHQALVGGLNGTPGLIEQTNRNTNWRVTVNTVLKWMGTSVIGLTFVSLFIFYLKSKLIP